MDVTRDYVATSGRIFSICAGNSTLCNLMSEGYAWDNAGNLAAQQKENRYLETFTYDSLNRLTASRLTMQDGVTVDIAFLTLQYDKLGNICRKGEKGRPTYDYTYTGRAGCGLGGANSSYGGGGSGTVGPHQLFQLGTDNFYYDGRGNQTVKDAASSTYDRTIKYSIDDQAYEAVSGTGVRTRFWYGSDGARYKRDDDGKKTLYLGNVEIVTQGAVTTIKRTIAGVMLQTVVGATATNYYLFHDQLGSLVKITNATGGVVSSQDYAALGYRRDVDTQYSNGGTVPALTTRGFTGHEMVDGVLNIIHMNGRIFDPGIGRFLQADPVIQDPGNAQSWNAYTYVLNNPLAYTDPTGMFSWSKYWRPILAIAISVVTYGAASGWAAGWLASSVAAGTMTATSAAVTTGIIAGATAGFVGGAIATGSFKGAVYGAFTGAVFGGIGGYYGNTWNFQRVAVESFAGGVTSEMTGGSFKDGFRMQLLFSTMNYAATTMRSRMIAQSKLNPKNIGAESAGFRNDQVKIAGVRYSNDGTVSTGPFGGIQGEQGTFFGQPYASGSYTDRFLEAWAGPHDWFSSILYDPLTGNNYVRQGMASRALGTFWSGASLALAAPFVTASVMSQHAYLIDLYRREWEG